MTKINIEYKHKRSAVVCDQSPRLTTWNGFIKTQYGFQVANSECCRVIKEGQLAVVIAQINTYKGTRYDVWNYHPSRSTMQLVYSLDKCPDVEQQLKESMASLLRLYPQ